MKGKALLLLCAITLTQAEQPQLTLSGKVCNCNPGEAASVCSQNGSDNELIVHENCNQFYKCSNGAAVPYYCPSNLLYNPLTELCDWPDNVVCGDRPIVDPGTGGEDCSQENDNNGNEGNGGEDNGGDGTDDNNNGGTCNCKPEEAPAICAALGSNGVLIAHQNCNQFYKCDHGVPVVLNCPSGLLYNPYTEQCDWAHNVECGDRPIVEIGGGGNNGGDEDCDESGNGNGESGSGGGSGGGDNGNGGTCNCNPGEAPGICAADGSDGVLVAHQNCNQFYKCDHGVPIVLNCPPGLLYNPYTEICDWPHNVDCGDRPIVDIDGGGNNGPDEDCDEAGNGNGDNGGGNGDNGSGDSGGGGDNGGTCNCNPGEAPGICSAAGSEGVLVAHENCNQFYKCSHGLPVPLFCPHGLHYNPYIERCDWPDLVECGDRPVVEGGGNGDNGSGGNGDNGGGGNGDNGSGDNGGGDSGSGGDNGGTCNCNPGEAPGICSAAGSEGVLVAHENCNQFYKCSHGLPVALFCPEGLNYNPHIQRCDWPGLVECGDRPVVEGGGNGDNGSGGNGDNGGGGNGDNGSGDNGGGDSGSGGDNGGTCNCNPGEAPGICGAAGSEGVLVAHENCNQFYKCSHGLPVALFCPEGLNYNPHIQRCDWPALVECGDRPVVEGGGNGDNGSGGNGDNGGGGNGDNGSGDNGGGDSGSGGDNGGTCNCNPGEAPGICSAAGSEGVLVAHENCNQFYKCSHGLPVALFCPEGLNYNPHIQRCDWPGLVECGDRPVVEGGGNGDNGSGGNGDNGGGGNGDNGSGDNGGGDSGSGGDNGGTCNCNPGEAPGICGAAGSEGVLVAHENCNQFYKCSHGLPVALFCPEGLNYNPHIQRCDWPGLVECGDRPVVEGGGNGDNGSGGNGDNGGGGNGDNGSGDNGGGDSGSGGDNGGTCNCNPGEAPGICSAAGSEGVLVAHENCNQFYKCSHGLPVALFCPEGLNYNPHIQRCDWPGLVECGDRPVVEGGGNGDNGSGGNGDNGGGGNGDNGSGDNGGGDSGSGGDNGGTCNCNPGEAPGICGAAGSEGVLVAHENCNQFYKCSHGLPVALFCPEGLNYNPHIQRCDWPGLVECGDRPVVEGGGNGDNGSGGSGDNGGGNDNNNDNCDPGQAPAICSASGSDGVLVAHENCNQFYKCSEGLPVALDCPANLMYNSVLQVCDWPQNVDCGNRVVPNPEEDNNNGGGDNGGDNGGGGGNGGNNNGDNCDPSQAPTICAASGSDGVLVAHENCNQFYKCSEGLPVALDCPANLMYNSVLQVCDWPENVDCGNRVVPNPEEDNNNGGGDNGGDNGGGGGNGGNNNGDNCDPSQAPTICAASGSDGVLVAHENCNQFYKCSEGLPVALDCPANLMYNSVLQVCDWPQNVDCGNRVVPNPEEDNNNGGGDNGGDNGGGGGNGGNNNGDNCDPSQAPTICAASGSDGVLVAHENCNQFYKCSEGLPVALDCPANLMYNSVLQVCDWPQNVDCGNRVVPNPEEDNNNNGGGDNGGDNGGGGGNGGSNNGDNCDPSLAPTICAASGSDGVLVAHENCNQFYKCSEGLPVALDCPANLMYNSVLQVCDWPENVDCGNRAVPNPEEDNNNGGGDNGGDDNDGDNGNVGGNCDPSQAPTICANSGSNGVLVAHENCDQFYVCSYGLPVALNCPSNLLYNSVIGQCDWPRNVDCGDRIVPTPESDSDGPCSCNAREAPSICSRTGSNGKLIAHESCNQYYVCFEGIAVARSCPQSLFYEPHSEQCLWPASVNCEGRAVTGYASFNKHLQARREVL